jgi:hypothetical protein
MLIDASFRRRNASCREIYHRGPNLSRNPVRVLFSGVDQAVQRTTNSSTPYLRRVMLPTHRPCGDSPVRGQDPQRGPERVKPLCPSACRTQTLPTGCVVSTSRNEEGTGRISYCAAVVTKLIRKGDELVYVNRRLDVARHNHGFLAETAMVRRQYVGKTAGHLHDGSPLA